MTGNIHIQQLTASAFKTFGDVIDSSGEPTSIINSGNCERYNDRARVDIDAAGKPGISIFYGQPYSLPLALAMVERHPLGSQAFLPMSESPFLVIVAEDNAGTPAKPKAFLTTPQQGVNILRGVWHGVLTPLSGPAQFAVVDWIGNIPNLEEHYFDEPWIVCESK